MQHVDGRCEKCGMVIEGNRKCNYLWENLAISAYDLALPDTDSSADTIVSIINQKCICKHTYISGQISYITEVIYFNIINIFAKKSKGYL